MSGRGPAGRRNFDPDNNGISADRYLMTDCALRCGDALHDDLRYGAEVMRWRRLAAPHINRWWKAWVQLRDGYKDPVMGAVEGFWTDDNGKPLGAGARIPKAAYTGMEGAIMQILHLDGIYWIKDRQKSETKGAYAKVIEKRAGANGDAEPDDDADDPSDT